MAAAGVKPIYLLAAAIHAYDRGQRLEDYDEAREERRRQADRAYVLQPPPQRGYGYATDADLKALGYDREADRHRDLERWRHDLQLAADSGLITEQEGEEAWQSATKTHPSNSSTGMTSTTASTKTTTPSSKASPTRAAGQQWHPRRKQGNRRSSSPSRWKPQ